MLREKVKEILDRAEQIKEYLKKKEEVTNHNPDGATKARYNCFKITHSI